MTILLIIIAIALVGAVIALGVIIKEARDVIGFFDGKGKR